MQGLEFLSVANLTGAVMAILDRRDRPATYRRFIGRVPSVPAMPGEIMVRVYTQTLLADIIEDDAKARIQGVLKFQPFGVDIPNIKHGTGINQAMMNLIRRVGTNLAGRDETGMLVNMTEAIVQALVDGVEGRENTIAVAMMIDRGLPLGSLGIQSTPDWGTPAALKANSAVPVEANPTTSLIIDEIYTLINTARVYWGENYNRIEGSSSAFRAIINTDNYKKYATAMLPAFMGSLGNAVPPSDLGTQQMLLSRVLGIPFVIVDDRHWTQSPAGVTTQAPFLPEKYLLLTDTADDGNRATWDFAQDLVTESLLSEMMPAATIPGLAGLTPRRGPVAFGTLATHDANPPGFNVWGVDRGFCRKKRLTASASIDIGAVTDRYPPINVFPT